MRSNPSYDQEPDDFACNAAAAECAKALQRGALLPQDPADWLIQTSKGAES